jgi:hypothetical protein
MNGFRAAKALFFILDVRALFFIYEPDVMFVLFIEGGRYCKRHLHCAKVVKTCFGGMTIKSAVASTFSSSKTNVPLPSTM